jgi:hypothetical protein
MTGSKLRRLALAATLALGLAACAGNFGNGYRGGYNAQYDRYYGDANGFRNVPFGYAGSNFGWSRNSYYPGTGVFVFDRSGAQRQWNRREQRYWQHRARQNQNDRRDRRQRRPR